eukprot:2274362-Rhodomonas_salina.1
MATQKRNKACQYHTSCTNRVGGQGRACQYRSTGHTAEHSAYGYPYRPCRSKSTARWYQQGLRWYPRVLIRTSVPDLP